METLREPHRYPAFDVLRGVAAITVVIGHFQMVTRGAWPPHYYLAVDLFFLLSGFVLAARYDPRFAAGLTAVEFMKSRAIRLWPIVLIGAVTGLLVQLDYGMPMGSQLHSFVAVVLNGFALPSPPRPPPDPAQLTPINTVLWTLMLEFWVANLAFAAFWRWLRGPALWAVIAAGLIGLIVAEQISQSLAGGWGWGNGGVGLARVTYSFFLGVALSRRFPAGIQAIRLPGWLYAVDVVAVFFVQFGGHAGLFDLIDVVLVLPLLLVLAAGAAAASSRIGPLLGDASYALYALHMPFLVEAMSLLQPQGGYVAWEPALYYGAMAATVAILVAVSLAVDRWIDRPTRRWLTRMSSDG